MADWQSLDPEAAREAEKYENPIPSRELILQHLAERGSPASREQLVEEFGLTTKMEGKDQGDWVLIDTGDVIIHLFRPEVRSFYNLERMWAFGDTAPVTGTA